MSVTAADIAEVLGGQRVLGRRIRHGHDLEELIREGVPKPALERLVALLAEPTHGGDGRDLKAGLRNRIVSRATYQRAKRFNLQVSETTERLARLYALAASAFADGGAAARFMLTPHPELGDRAPFDVALTEVGGREVEEVIERGLHGLPA
ncbi:MAG: DUF2384 domain-containing protein [Spirochaetaceae bacterium]|nr:DUF2384 domain-containing protein [Spirochaetaceae bacterium]